MIFNLQDWIFLVWVIVQTNLIFALNYQIIHQSMISYIEALRLLPVHLVLAPSKITWLLSLTSCAVIHSDSDSRHIDFPGPATGPLLLSSLSPKGSPLKSLPGELTPHWGLFQCYSSIRLPYHPTLSALYPVSWFTCFLSSQHQLKHNILSMLCYVMLLTVGCKLKNRDLGLFRFLLYPQHQYSALQGVST